MSKTKIVLNDAGVRELLRSGQMKAICEDHASAIRSRCGFGYESDSYSGKNRVNAMVWAATRQSQEDNIKNNTLLKALR